MGENGSGDGSDPDARGIRGEVTRIEAVGYLQGASGHAVVSTAFLVVAWVALARGRTGVGVVVLLVAYGVALNGLSIYAWDALRDRFRAAFERSNDGPARTLTPHRVSAELKAETAAGVVMLGSLVALLLAATVVFGETGFRNGLVIASAALAVGNAGSLCRSYYAS